MPNTADSVRSQLNLQTYTIEYQTQGGAFDGRTVAPAISVNPESEDYVAPDPVDGVYRRVLDQGVNVGLIDLSLGSPNEGGIGDRYVRQVLAGNPAGAVIFSSGILGVYDDLYRQLNVGTDPLLLELVRQLSGIGGFYEPSCIFVPQGSYLGISGLAAADNLIRITVEVPETPWDAALLEESCCCDAGEGSDTGDCPVILDISPSVIEVPVGPFPTLTIFGTGFADGLAIEAENAFFPGTFATLSEFAIIDSTTATVEVQAPTPAGTYNLRIFDPADPENCFGEAQFTVTDALDACTQLDISQTNFPPAASPGQSIIGAQITGTNMDNVTLVEIYDNTAALVASIPGFAFTSQDSSQITFDFTIDVLAGVGPAIVRVYSQINGQPCPNEEFGFFIASPG